MDLKHSCSFSATPFSFITVNTLKMCLSISMSQNDLSLSNQTQCHEAQVHCFLSYCTCYCNFIAPKTPEAGTAVAQLRLCLCRSDSTVSFWLCLPTQTTSYRRCTESISQAASLRQQFFFWEKPTWTALNLQYLSVPPTGTSNVLNMCCSVPGVCWCHQSCKSWSATLVCFWTAYGLSFTEVWLCWSAIQH